MIKKLYKFKKTQSDQVIAQKQRLVNKVLAIDEEIASKNSDILSSCVSNQGKISDFEYLANRKEILGIQIAKLKFEQATIKQNIIELEQKMIILNQECEQYDYLLQIEKQEAYKQMLKEESTVSEEFVQSQFFAKRKENSNNNLNKFSKTDNFEDKSL